MTSSEEGGMYWWVAPSSPFVVVSTGIALLSSVLVVVRCCPLFVAVHRSLLSVFVLVGRTLLSRFPSLAWRLAMGDGRRRRWCCRVSWAGVCPVVADGGRGLFS